MNIRLWSHRNGFRSPTEQQLVRWELDGGSELEYENAVLFEGRLYDCQASLLKARVEGGIKKIAAFLKKRLEARTTPRPLSAPLLS
ncbi:hypothetical protein BH10BDE1_BH10BDE1_11620 [soil metagenome]